MSTKCEAPHQPRLALLEQGGFLLLYFFPSLLAASVGNVSLLLYDNYIVLGYITAMREPHLTRQQTHHIVLKSLGKGIMDQVQQSWTWDVERTDL